MSAGYIIYSLDWDKFQKLVQRPTPQQLGTLGQLLADGLEEHDGEFDEGDPILEWPTDAKKLAQVAAKRLALADWYGDLSTAGKALWEGVVVAACMNREEMDLDFRVDSDGVYWDVIELAWKKLGVAPNTISDVALSTFGVRPFRYHPPGTGQSRDDFDRAQQEKRASLDEMGKMLSQFLQSAKRGQADPSKLMQELEQSQGLSGQHKNMLKAVLNDDDSDDEDEDDDDAAPWDPMHSMHTPDEVPKMLSELQSAAPAIKKNKDARRDYEEELLPALEQIVADGRMLFVQVDT